MNINEILLKCIEIDLRNIELLNEYSKKYNYLSADKIMEKLNEDEEYIKLTIDNKKYRDDLATTFQNSNFYLTGTVDENGFLVDIATVKKDDSIALFIYTSLDEILESKHYIEISYNDLRDYILSNKEIKRIIVNKNSSNVLLGKSNFIRGNMYGLLIKNKLELD